MFCKCLLKKKKKSKNIHVINFGAPTRTAHKRRRREGAAAEVGVSLRNKSPAGPRDEICPGEQLFHLKIPLETITTDTLLFGLCYICTPEAAELQSSAGALGFSFLQRGVQRALPATWTVLLGGGVAPGESFNQLTILF